MIEGITIKNTASYDDGGVQVNNLKKINYIYGANGSGKTTISYLIASQADSQYKDCEVQWAHGQQLNALVYNKKFRENNFGKGKIEGVFTLGRLRKNLKLLKKNKLT